MDRLGNKVHHISVLQLVEADESLRIELQHKVCEDSGWCTSCKTPKETKNCEEWASDYVAFEEIQEEGYLRN